MTNKRLKSDDSDQSLARSRPIRQIKPNSRFKSPEIEVKIPRSLRVNRTRIKNEPKEMPLTKEAENDYDFSDESKNSINFNDNSLSKLKPQAKERRVTANKSRVPVSQVVAPVLESRTTLTNGPTTTLHINTSSSTPVSPLVSPRRGRPKGVKNKTTLEKLRLQSLDQGEIASHVTPARRKTKNLVKQFNVGSPNCNCRPKWEKILKTVKEDLDTQHKDEIKRVNYISMSYRIIMFCICVRILVEKRFGKC